MDKATTQPLIEADRLYDNTAAADYLDVSPSALRNSRNTGRLLGVTAPAFLKMGPNVRYKGHSLREWRDQFQEQRPKQLELPGIG